MSQLRKYICLGLITSFILAVFIPSVVFANDLDTYGGTGSLNISPESGSKNTAISLEGSGFKPEEEIEIILYKTEEEKIFISNIFSDDKGKIKFSFFIPSNIGIGYYKIEARGSQRVLWADYYITSERRFSLMTFIISLSGAFLTGAGVMYVAMKLYHKKHRTA